MVAATVFECLAEFQKWLERTRQQGQRIVWMPTSGFLHLGHIALGNKQS